jgi:MFS family permease
MVAGWLTWGNRRSMLVGISRTFDSLRVRNYRMFFAAQIPNWAGTWVEWVAQGWLVLRITHSGFMLGLVTALAWSPILLFGPWAGVLVDRFEKRRILLFTNVASGLGALSLGIATITGIVTLWMVVVVALLLGFITALDSPSRQTFTLEMVGRDRLTNAVSLNTASFTIARVLGPAIAGFLITTVGIGECFLLNALSFIPITIVLSRIKRDELSSAEPIERRPGQVREGLRYVASEPLLRGLLTIMAIVGTLQYNFQLLLPLLAKETFSGNAATLGLLGTMLGIGMLIGSLTNAALGRPVRNVLLAAGLLLGAFTLLVAAAPALWLAAILMIPLGAASMSFLATINATLQLSSSDAMRGRVMGLYFVLFLGSTPIGAPLLGWIAEAFTPRAALGLGGVATLGACAYALFRLPRYAFPAAGVDETADKAMAKAALQEPR